MSKPQYFLVNAGFKEGNDFRRNLLRTGEFSASVFPALKVKGGDKEAKVASLMDMLDDEDVSAEQVVRSLCEASRTWLHYATTEYEIELPQKGSAEEFLTKFGSAKGWYGPISSEDDSSRHWYLRTQSVKHYIDVGVAEGEKEWKAVGVRWHVVCEVGEDYIALHWNGFSHIETEDSVAMSGNQFPYWQHIREIRDEFLSILGLGVEHIQEPAMHQLVLKTLFDQYETDPKYSWKHLRVRAEQYGVAMNAKSSSASVQDADLGGLRELTSALAKNAAHASGHGADLEVISKIERALLRTFIREWGTLSYEFQLAKSDSEKFFRSHIYFGERQEGPDSLQHCKCFRQWGGSTRVLNFLLEHG